MNAERKADLDERHGESAIAYQMGVPVNLAQLDAEIGEATGLGPGHVIVEGGETGGGLISPGEDEENPLLVWVVGKTDARTVGSALREHEAAPEWGLPDHGAGLDALAKKIEEGGTLDEVETAYVIEQLLRERSGA